MTTQTSVQSIMPQRVDIDTFLEALYPRIITVAKRIYSVAKALGSVPADLDDLIQVGMIAAWQATSMFEEMSNPHSFCAKRAEWKMRNYLRDSRRYDAESLERWLMPPADGASVSRDIAATTPFCRPTTDAFYAKKHQLMALLEVLPIKYQAVLTAEYLAGRRDHRRCITKEGVCKHYKLTTRQYELVRRSALVAARRKIQIAHCQ